MIRGKKNPSGCTVEATEEKGAHIWQREWGVKYVIRVLHRCNEPLGAYRIQALSDVNIISVGCKRRCDKPIRGQSKKFLTF